MKPIVIASLLCGVLFGFGLSLSQMADQSKVLSFLDVAGNWDPSLLLVLGGAVGVTALTFGLITKRSKPVYDTVFETVREGQLDRSLIGGAALFGIGWGLSGFCPGPGIVALARLSPDAFIFVACFFAGSFLYRRHRDGSERSA